MILSKIDLNYYLKQDKVALGITECTWWNKLKRILFPNHIHKYEIYLRKLEYYENVGRHKSIIGKLMWIYYKLKHRNKGLLLGLEIPPNCFGPGLSIPHAGTIIVNPTARVGAFCRLHAGVNIGASGGNPKAPEIGDNVYIGPGAIIFGDIRIADKVTIGANATVNKTCSRENVVLAGTPAQIVKDSMPDWTTFNKIK